MNVSQFISRTWTGLKGLRGTADAPASTRGAAIARKLMHNDEDLDYVHITDRILGMCRNTAPGQLRKLPEPKMRGLTDVLCSGWMPDFRENITGETPKQCGTAWYISQEHIWLS